MEPQIYFTEEHREIHMCGQMVGVCWNVREHQRVADPYVDFVSILHKSVPNTYCEDEDSPIVGRLNLYQTQQLIDELIKAVEYLRTQEECD